MNWIFYYKKEWLNKDSSPLQSIYLRPVRYDDEKKLVGKIVDLDIIALEYFIKEEFQALLKDDGLDKIYLEQLAEKDYYIKEEVEDGALFSHKATIYLKDEIITPSSLFEWVEVYFKIQGIPYSAFEATDYTDFVDTNPFYSLLTEGARKSENKWGKEWWKRDKE